MDDEYFGSKEEDMRAEGAIMVQEARDELLARGYEPGTCALCGKSTLVLPLDEKRSACHTCAPF